MPRLRALALIGMFVFSVFGRGFAFKPVENPFRYLGGSLTESAGDVAIDETTGGDDEFSPMKPFKAQVRQPVASVPTPARMLVLDEPSPQIARFDSEEPRTPPTVAHVPGLRPPIALA
ncbi:MAG: hypothetical protein JST04_13650 [Bdellovibrionales bacterium]|nr:hypothetical protein [Bdellovibrionales bacterium]